MVSSILSVFSVVMFCFCCQQLLKAMVFRIPALPSERLYAQGAMQLAKFYKIISWGTLTGSFLVGLVISFYKVYTEL